MAQPEARTIRPADILEMIRQNGEQGFVQRNFRDPAEMGKFGALPPREGAVIIEPEGGPVEVLPPEPKGIPEAEVEHKLAAARAAAKAEGIAEERARLTAELAAEREQVTQATAAFERVIARLSEVHPDDSAALVGSLEEAIRRLASERAGVQIDETPVAFLRRIETLADRVAQGVRSVRIRLNPGDFAAIHPFLEASETIDDSIISADLSLGRGDVIIRSEAVRMEDVIAPAKVDAKPARKAPLKPAPKAE